MFELCLDVLGVKQHPGLQIWYLVSKRQKNQRDGSNSS